MTKKYLYIVIAVLLGILLYVLFMPVAVTHEKSQEVTESVVSEDTDEVVLDEVVVVGIGDDTTQIDETIVLEGTFVGLLADEDKFQKKFNYMLLNDGVEVVRIDLRPLIGNSAIDIIAKLGVDRGDEVRVIGKMNKGVFVVESVE